MSCNHCMSSDTGPEPSACEAIRSGKQGSKVHQGAAVHLKVTESSARIQSCKLYVWVFGILWQLVSVFVSRRSLFVGKSSSSASVRTSVWRASRPLLVHPSGPQRRTCKNSPLRPDRDETGRSRPRIKAHLFSRCPCP